MTNFTSSFFFSFPSSPSSLPSTLLLTLSFFFSSSFYCPFPSPFHPPLLLLFFFFFLFTFFFSLLFSLLISLLLLLLLFFVSFPHHLLLPLFLLFRPPPYLSSFLPPGFPSLPFPPPSSFRPPHVRFQRGLGWSASRSRIRCILTLKYDILVATTSTIVLKINLP